MIWHMIRLDLARSPDMPGGSAATSYLLRLPLDGAGMIDRTALEADSARASVLRSLPDAPEASGHVFASETGWIFSYMPGDGDDETLFHPEIHPFRAGDYCSIRGEDDALRTFRITACTPIGERIAEDAAPAR